MNANPQVLAGEYIRDIFTAFFSNPEWQDSLLDMFAENWDDFKNDIVPGLASTSADKHRHKKRKAIEDRLPTAIPSRSPSPSDVPDDQAFAILVKQLFRDFVKTPQMQQWLANLFSTMVCVEKTDSLPSTCERMGKKRPLNNLKEISDPNTKLTMCDIQMRPKKTEAFRVVFEYNYDRLCTNEGMKNMFVDFCLKDFGEKTDQLLKLSEAWTHRLGSITESTRLSAVQVKTALPKAPERAQKQEGRSYHHPHWNSKEASKREEADTHDDDAWGDWRDPAHGGRR